MHGQGFFNFRVLVLKVSKNIQLHLQVMYEEGLDIYLQSQATVFRFDLKT